MKVNTLTLDVTFYEIQGCTILILRAIYKIYSVVKAFIWENVNLTDTHLEIHIYAILYSISTLHDLSD